MPPDRICMFPRKTKLKLMAGNYFVYGVRPRIFRQRQWWHILIPLLLKRFERDRPIPLLTAHGQKLFGRVGQQRDVFQEKDVGVATKRRFFRQRRQFLLEPASVFFERVRGTLSCAV